MTEIHAFPEEAQQGRRVEAAVGARGVDRMYQTQSSYRDVVKFFDQNLSSSGFVTPHQTTSSQNATTWSAKTADGKPIRIAVRNSQPTTVEILAVTGEAAAVDEMRPQSGSQSGSQRRNVNPNGQPKGQMPSGEPANVPPSSDHSRNQ